MQWEGRKNGGFTEGTPWIPVNQNFPVINADSQRGNPNSVYEYYKKLIRLRHENEIIVYGNYELLLPEDEKLYVYTRTLGGESLLIICNFSEDPLEYQLPEMFTPNTGTLLISNYPEDLEDKIRPYEAKVYLVKK
jgi:glycosidase